MTIFAEVRDTYQRTQKPHDIFWNRFVARPAAAVVLVPLARSRVTPNQVTFASLFVFAAAIALLVVRRDLTGLIAAALVLELSYVLDCVDGQLARLRGTSTTIGAHLDFLMDELKAFLLVAGVGARLWLATNEALWLVEGLAGLVVVASAISLTTFVRRPEYAQATGARTSAGSGDYGDGFAGAEAPPKAAPGMVRGAVGLAVRVVERFGRFVIHYPSYIVFVALADRIDLFLHAYVAVNALYAARTFLGITLRLGRSRA